MLGGIVHFTVRVDVSFIVNFTGRVRVDDRVIVFFTVTLGSSFLFMLGLIFVL